MEAMVEEPWEWSELYLDGGVKAFRWWQGVGPGEALAAGGDTEGRTPRGRLPGPGEVASPARGSQRGLLRARDDRTIYSAVKKRGKRRGR